MTLSTKARQVLNTAVVNRTYGDEIADAIDGIGDKAFTGNVSIAGDASIAGDVSIAGTVAHTDIGTIAAAGSSQSDATAIVNTITIVTDADGTKGVILPAVTAGAYYEVYNSVATNGLKIYPATGDDINDGTADAAITTEGKTHAIFRGLDDATWAAVFVANS